MNIIYQDKNTIDDNCEEHDKTKHENNPHLHLNGQEYQKIF